MLSAKSDRLKRLRRLVNQRQARSQERAFVAEGPVLVAEALTAATGAGLPVLEIYSEEPVDPEVARRALDLDLTVTLVAPGGLRAVLDTVTPRPVCAVIGLRSAEIDDLGEGPVLVLAELADPGNVGTLIRTAEAAGFAGVVMAGNAVDSTNPKVVRAAAGARFRLPVVVSESLEAAASALRATGRPVIATVVDDGIPLDDHRIDLTAAAIVLGNEAHGLSAADAGVADRRVTIPLAGPTESLNVAAAGAVLCFESLRQRRLRR